MLAAALVGCGGAAAPTAPSAAPTAPPPVPVVTTITVLADLAQNVAGNLADVRALVPPGTDAHSFQTTPEHSVAVSQAKLIITNGLRLDAFIDPVIASARRADAVHIVLAEGLEAAPIEELTFPGETPEALEFHVLEEVEELIEAAHAGALAPAEAVERITAALAESPEPAAGEPESEERHLLEELAQRLEQGQAQSEAPEASIAALEAILEEEGHDHGSAHANSHALGDPHLWMNPVFAIRYVERIRDGLIQVDPANAAAYRQNAAAYIENLRQLDQELAQTLSQVPPQRRHLVTFHDAYGYFAGRYGWRVSAFVPSDASEVTPAAIKAILTQLGEQQLPAIFAEPQLSNSVIQQAARDSGVKVGLMRSDALDAQTPSYIEMMRSNARSLAENLGPGS